jgi:hypothetical protein
MKSVLINFRKRGALIASSFIFLSACSPSLEGAPAPRLQPGEGDRIVFLGNAFFEQAIRHGELETSLALRWPEKNLSFRNVGWSGDTVFGHSRTFGRRGAKFGGPEAGFENMSEHLAKLGPDMVFVAYGFNESFEEEAGLEAFRQGALRLLEMLGALNSEIVLLSPPPMELDFGAPAEYVEKRNAWLQRYSEEMKALAESRGLAYVDLFKPLKKQAGTFSKDGIHPSGDGYRRIGDIIAETLDLPQPIAQLDSKEAAQIRSEIIEKNQLFFHRWRPRNDAFVFGERKDEQRIAQMEPAKIEPFVEKKESIINTLVEAQR